MIVGAPGDGRAYIYVNEGLYWRYLQTHGWRGQFGYDMDISGNTLVVGAPGYNMVDVFNFNFTTGYWDWQGWSIQRAGGTSDFGRSVAIDGGRIAVGAPWTSVWYASSGQPYAGYLLQLGQTGAVFTYTGGGGSWGLERFIMPFDSGMPNDTSYAQWWSGYSWSDLNYGTGSFTVINDATWVTSHTWLHEACHWWEGCNDSKDFWGDGRQGINQSDIEDGAGGGWGLAANKCVLLRHQ